MVCLVELADGVVDLNCSMSNIALSDGFVDTVHILPRTLLDVPFPLALMTPTDIYAGVRHLLRLQCLVQHRPPPCTQACKGFSMFSGGFGEAPSCWFFSKPCLNGPIVSGQ